MNNVTKEKISAAIKKVFFQRGHGVTDIEFYDDKVCFSMDNNFFRIASDRFTVEDCAFTFSMLDKLVDIAPAENIIAQAFYSLETMGTELQEKGIEINLQSLIDEINESLICRSLVQICSYFDYEDGLALILRSWHCTPEEVKVIKWVASFLQPSELFWWEVLRTEESF